MAYFSSGIMLIASAVHSYIPADTAFFARFLIDDRPLIAPVASFIVQRGAALDDGSRGDFHDASLRPLGAFF
jgi:hypothetical protein